MNKVILTKGKLGRDPELKQAGETTVCNFSAAFRRRFAKNNETDWINITAFGKTAEFICKYFQKGSSIDVFGHIQTGSYTNKDGVKVNTTNIIAEEVDFGDSKKNKDTSESKENVKDDDYDGFNVSEGFTDVEDALPFN